MTIVIYSYGTCGIHYWNWTYRCFYMIPKQRENGYAYQYMHVYCAMDTLVTVKHTSIFRLNASVSMTYREVRNRTYLNLTVHRAGEQQVARPRKQPNSTDTLWIQTEKSSTLLWLGKNNAKSIKCHGLYSMLHRKVCVQKWHSSITRTKTKTNKLLIECPIILEHILNWTVL